MIDQFRALDEEIARLPDRLRDPIVLCLMEGHTQEEAAAELGRDARTVRRRLGRAKQVLRARLERRGVLPLVVAALVSGGGAVSAVPQTLVARTTAAVFDFLTGGTGAARSAPVVLAKGVAMTMFTRKLMHLMGVAVAGLIGVGVVLAGEDKPVPTPQVTQLTVPLAAPPASPLLPVVPRREEFDGARNDAQPQKLLADSRPPVKKERGVLIEGMCVRVPAGFCERCGLDEGATGGAVSMLLRREARMLTELLRVEPGREVISDPKMILADKQTGFAQVGQDVPYVAGEESATKDGKPARVEKIAYQSVGVTLRVTPMISADGTSIQLRTETQTTQVAATPVNLGNGVQAPTFNTQSCQTTVLIPDGGTVVLRTNTSDGGKDATEQLWVLTAQIRGSEKAPPASVKPLIPIVPPPVVAPQPLPAAKVVPPAKP